MKKLALIFVILLSVVFVSAQNTLTFRADQYDTIQGRDAGNSSTYTVGPILNGPYPYAIDVYVTASGTHADDSTHVAVYASMDGTNFVQLTDLGTPLLISYGLYNAATPTAVAYKGKRYSNAGLSGGATAGWIWHPTWYLQYRYLRIQITQWKAASILTVNRAKLHIFKGSSY